MGDIITQILTGTGKVIVVGILLGAGLPLLFSAGIVLQDRGAGGTLRDGTRVQPSSLARVAAWIIFAVITLVIIYGLLFITKDSLGHYLGIHLPI